MKNKNSVEQYFNQKDFSILEIVLIIIAVISLILELSGAAFVNRLNAEPLEFIHEHYSIEDGLPHNSISQIYKDSRGYLWLCTWYGLSRYDGSSNCSK